MRLIAIFLASFLYFANAPAETNASTEPAFVYQRIHSLVQHHDNRITLRVWEDGRVEMRFPVYTPRAGHYQRQLDQSERDELNRIVSVLANIQPTGLVGSINVARQTSRVEVSDADIIRFYRQHTDREAFDLLVPAPDVWSSLAPEITELAVLNELEQDLRGWMDRQIQRMETN